MMKYNFTFKFYCFVFCLLLFGKTLLAQTAVKTVIVSTAKSILVTQTQRALVSFELSTVPVGAIIDSGYLNLTLLTKINKTITIEVHKMAVEPGDTTGRVNSKTLYPTLNKNAIISMGVSQKYLKKLPQSREIRFQLSATAASGIVDTALKAKFYGTDDLVAGNTPRLIVYYHYPDEISNNMPTVEWASSRADYMHSSRSNVAFLGAEPTGFQFDKIGNNTMQTDLCIYNQNLYLVNYQLTENTLFAADPLISSKNPGMKYRVNPNPLFAPKMMPAINNDGRLYYTSENEISVIDVPNGGKTSTAISIPSGNEIKTPPTIGPDGSLYIVFKDMIQAYSPYPKHQLMWIYSQDGDKSPVTLSQDGSLAYVILYDTKKVVALNTNNGLPLAKQGNVVMHKLTTIDGPSIPLTTNDGCVYIANNLFNADTMYVFDRQLNRVRAMGGKKISQPASGKNGMVYFMRNDSLIQSGPKASVPLAAMGNGNPIRSLVTDLSNNVYGLFTKGADVSILHTYSGITQKLIEPVEFKTDGIQKAMIIGPDGNLYTATSNELIRIKPVFNSDYTYKKSDESYTNVVFRANTISATDNTLKLSNKKTLIGSNGVTISATIATKAEITVESGSGIVFGTGFKVEKGATLSCKTGY